MTPNLLHDNDTYLLTLSTSLFTYTVIMWVCMYPTVCVWIPQCGCVYGSHNVGVCMGPMRGSYD